jgi:hypothetical protein
MTLPPVAIPDSGFFGKKFSPTRGRDHRRWPSSARRTHNCTKSPRKDDILWRTLRPREGPGCRLSRHWVRRSASICTVSARRAVRTTGTYEMQTLRSTFNIVVLLLFEEKCRLVGRGCALVPLFVDVITRAPIMD